MTASNLVAEALVAARLGLDSLSVQTHGESGEIGSSGLIALSRPAVSVQSLVLAGAGVAGVLVSPRVIDVSGIVRPYLTGGLTGTVYARLPYLVSYTTGWDVLPDAVSAAVQLVADWRATVPVGVASEAIGPVNRSYVQSAEGSFPPDALLLLRPWLPLRF